MCSSALRRLTRASVLGFALAGAARVAAAQPLPDAGVTEAVDAGVDAGVDEAPSEEDERAAARVMPDEREPPDPIAEEAERSGPFEGPAPAEHPALATEIAALSDRACYRALTRARVSFDRVRSLVAGVMTPVVVRGPLRGVVFRENRHRVVEELMDCRLAVALTRYASLLRAQGVREVHHISLYRAATPREIARQPVQTRHPGGMAIDVSSYIFDSGQELVVERDYHGRRRRPPCGPTARVPTQPQARALRTLGCEAARRGYFHVILGPNYNYEHRNHYHLEVARHVAWQFVR